MIRGLVSCALSVILMVGAGPVLADDGGGDSVETGQPDRGGRRGGLDDADTSIDGTGDRQGNGEVDLSDRNYELRQIVSGPLTPELASRLADLHRVLTDRNLQVQVVGAVTSVGLLAALRQFLNTGGLARLMVRSNPALALVPPQMIEGFFANPNVYYVPAHRQFTVADIVLALSLPPDEQNPDDPKTKGLPAVRSEEFGQYLIRVLHSIERQAAARLANEA